MTELQWIHLAYAVGLLLLVGPAAIALNRRGPVALRNIAVWLAIAAAAAAVWRLLGN